MVALLAASSVLATGANFSGSTTADGNSFGAAPDWAAPWVSLTDPGAAVSGTVTLSASATDSPGTGVASVTIQRSPAGAGTWTDICVDSSAPYSCDWDTTAGANAAYDLRAVAIDNASPQNSATSAVRANVIVDNVAPASVTMTNPGTPLTGTRTFSGSASDSGGSGMASLAFQYRTAGGGTWTTACSDPTTPYSCSFDTATVADGLYDMRSLASDNAGNTTASTTITNRRFDNTAPSGSLTDPGQYLAGTVAMTASAADGNGAGVTSVAFQRANSGSGTWTTICTDNSSPYNCSFDTTSVSDRQVDLRVLITDGAGFTTTSTVHANRWIDNTNPATANMTDPGSPLKGTVTLGATGTDAASGVASVTIQRAVANGSTFTNVCTDTSSPYECSFDTTAIADGLYDLRAIVTDYAGNTRTSARVQDRRIDNTAPTATMTDPGTNLRGTISLGATATDTGGSGVANVTIQRSPAGAGTWTDVCTDSTAAYSCSLDTTALSDGLYDLRAISVDNAGTSTTSALVVNRLVDNTVPSGVTMVDPGSPLAGTVTLSGAGSDSGSGMASLKLQYKLSANSTWLDVCTDTSAPYSCSFNTVAVADGSYDFRSLATDNAGNTAASTAHTPRHVNNGGPAVTMTDPGHMTGTVSLGATATDGNGVASVTIQRSPAGAGTWTDVCTDTTPAYSCSFNTTALPEGQYDLRAIAVDSLGSSSTSTVVGPRWIDRTGPTVTMTNPGTPLRGTVTLASTTSDAGAGMASVLYQRSPAGANTWTTACTGATSPFSCSFNTTTVADGSYDFRAIATDVVGNATTSAVITSRTIDNTAPTATNIQTTNVGTLGRPEVGDSMTLTFSEPVVPGTILAGWDGSALTVIAGFQDASVNGDEFQVWNTAYTTQANFGTITMGRTDFTSSQLGFLASTMTMSGSTVTITLGGTVYGSVTTVGGNGTMRWTPSNSITDIAGNPMSTALLTEPGTSDRDF